MVSGGALKEGSALHKVLQGLEKTIYAHARQIVVVTKGWEDHFREIGINVDKITVVPNGADLAEYEVKESREELRKEYGISGFTAVFSGTHANYVGLDLTSMPPAVCPTSTFCWSVPGRVSSGPLTKSPSSA